MTHPITIRKGESPDHDAIRHCVEAAYAPYIPRIGKRPASMDTDFTPLLRDGFVWVVSDEGRVVGLAVLIEESGSLEIRSIAVLPTHQRQGIGRTLIAHAEGLAREAGCVTIRLYTNANIPELITYYTDLGYAEVERRQDRGYDRVFMTKRLDKDHD